MWPAAFLTDHRNRMDLWRSALEKKGLAFIHPIPLEDPRQAHPPDELSSLHFNDIYLAILKSSEPRGSAPVTPV